MNWTQIGRKKSLTGWTGCLCRNRKDQKVFQLLRKRNVACCGKLQKELSCSQIVADQMAKACCEVSGVVSINSNPLSEWCLSDKRRVWNCQIEKNAFLSATLISVVKTIGCITAGNFLFNFCFFPGQLVLLPDQAMMLLRLKEKFWVLKSGAWGKQNWLRVSYRPTRPKNNTAEGRLDAFFPVSFSLDETPTSQIQTLTVCFALFLQVRHAREERLAAVQRALQRDARLHLPGDRAGPGAVLLLTRRRWRHHRQESRDRRRGGRPLPRGLRLLHQQGKRLSFPWSDRTWFVLSLSVHPLVYTGRAKQPVARKRGSTWPFDA